MRRILLLPVFIFCLITIADAQAPLNNPGSNHGNRFEQLGTMLPTPNEYRTASGAPGPKYWQQRCDYDITCELDEKQQKLNGKETLTYFNNSPDELRYLWLQLDENQHSSTNNAGYQNPTLMKPVMSDADLRAIVTKKDKEYGHNILKVTDAAGKNLGYTINKTMMRVELPQVLKPGQKFIFRIEWNYNIIDRIKYGGRGGLEYFAEDDNYLFTMSQWFPRLCVYSDNQGWQNQQFAGSGEFALTFGNYKVQMTVPADHIVGGTGECQNYAQVLTATQLQRWQKAQTSKEPVEVATLDEALKRMPVKSTAKKTWVFKADMVRDFAWTASRRFVWDAMPAMVEGKKVMCMSFYGKEAYPLYRKYSTKAVAHTIKTYSRFTIPYPYPVAQSVEAASGMEYPMICFNYGRAEKDGTYTEATKNGMLGVIIHEVGHNFFPMIINSDERQWTWMDEGLNSFVQYITEQLWDNKFPSNRGPAHLIVDYMKMPKSQLEPIMTNSENIVSFGNNAYGKPATGLNMLRETIMGRELFDYALREYARRWAFKHPTPADLFRTIEDASAEDLDWFWRGWFYTTDVVDISLDSVRWFRPDLANNPQLKDTSFPEPVPAPILHKVEDIAKIRNREDKSIVFATDVDTSLRDFYWRYARGLAKVDTIPGTQSSRYDYIMDDATKRMFAENKFFYELNFSNKGGMPMPIIIEWTYKDGTKEIEKIPVYIWRRNENNVSKVYVKDKEVSSIALDPRQETADIDISNHKWPVTTAAGRFQLYKEKKSPRGMSTGINPMSREIK